MPGQLQQQEHKDTINRGGQPQSTAQSQLGTENERIGELIHSVCGIVEYLYVNKVNSKTVKHLNLLWTFKWFFT